MEKNINEILKRVSERYGLKYTENGTGHTVKNGDGTTRPLTQDILEDVFGVNSNDDWIELQSNAVDHGRLDYHVKNHQNLKIDQDIHDFECSEVA